jgi:Holin of 3TMs, for gene-transfer release
MSIALLNVITTVLDKIIPDPTAAAAAKLEAMKLAQAGELAVLDADTKISLAQAEINKVDAGSGSMFRAGWRPAAGWACVAGLVMEFVMAPLLPWTLALFGKVVPPLPVMDMETLMGLLLALLGLGGYRTFERIKGKT